MARIFSICLFFILVQAKAQDRKIIQLDEHKIDLKESSREHQYNKLINKRIGDIHVDRILGLNNKTVETITKHFEGDVIVKEVTEKFDQFDNRIEIEVAD
ncbi:hypothetical protein MM239_10135 [Belliella sp. DSM 111904]|uniref:Uncharacterized protein n=1 Tax=Belliella filtrata TaxID=2923435 RepID=A0ABS9V094_9BACT|nr:hypothetical protein [Belliella filtrata]MCH7409753.1 hypothetical protein [Belliella filtrata]